MQIDRSDHSPPPALEPFIEVYSGIHDIPHDCGRWKIAIPTNPLARRPELASPLAVGGHIYNDTTFLRAKNTVSFLSNRLFVSLNRGNVKPILDSRLSRRKNSSFVVLVVRGTIVG